MEDYDYISENALLYASSVNESVHELEYAKQIISKPISREEIEDLIDSYGENQYGDMFSFFIDNIYHVSVFTNYDNYGNETEGGFSLVQELTGFQMDEPIMESRKSLKLYLFDDDPDAVLQLAISDVKIILLKRRGDINPVYFKALLNIHLRKLLEKELDKYGGPEGWIINREGINNYFLVNYVDGMYESDYIFTWVDSEENEIFNEGTDAEFILMIGRFAKRLEEWLLN